jgi:hypothetical protein
LQSFMTGDNPLSGSSAIEMPGAAARRQEGFNEQFGTWDRLLAADQEARAQTYQPRRDPGKVRNYYAEARAAPGILSGWETSSHGQGRKV